MRATRLSARAILAIAALLAPVAPCGTQDIRVREHVAVRRVLLDVRVVDSHGDPIRGLVPDDFRIQVDGQPAALESVEWISGEEPYSEGLTPEDAAAVGAPVTPQGRLIVYFFQTDFASVRLSGLMHMKFKAVELLQTLQPGDRVAVVSFDSHLKLRQDFTADIEELTAAIHGAILFGEERYITPGPFPSLAKSFDRAAAKRAAEPETGLLVTARALEALPGTKSLVFFGWGLGHLTRPWVTMGRDYAAARVALMRARVTVFAIDITDADYHDLEVGLEQVAADTGGFYAKTNLFPGQAMTRLQGAIAGHYVLVLVKPELPPGEHAVAIELTRQRGTVLANPTYED
jgi:VWFA-related protein